jgi:glycosyltransferase involved in cell wall biosynthesis
VADYTAILARALAPAVGAVHVWCPGNTSISADEGGGVVVHRSAGRFGPRSLWQLGRELDRFGPRTILVQYTPHAFGYKAMNFPFVAWVASRRLRHRDDVRIMFHEVAFPWVRRPLHHNLIAAANRLMAAILLRGCNRTYVSIPGWMPLLKQLGVGRRPMTWTPVPSNVPADPDPASVAARRAELDDGPVVGHFGTYGASVTGLLGPALRVLLDRRRDLRVLLLGSGGERWREEFVAGRPEWAVRVTATGPLPANAVSEALQSCDLVVQPYPDGASSRRGSLMAALANGVPVVTTLGKLSERIWTEGPVAAVPVGDPVRLAELVLELLGRPDRLADLGRTGRQLHEDRFAIERTVAALLSDSSSRTHLSCRPLADC